MGRKQDNNVHRYPRTQFKNEDENQENEQRNEQKLERDKNLEEIIEQLKELTKQLTYKEMYENERKRCSEVEDQLREQNKKNAEMLKQLLEIEISKQHELFSIESMLKELKREILHKE